MKKLYKTYIFWVGVLSLLGAICSFALPKNATNSNTDTGDREQEIEKVEMDDTEWKKKLTPEQYRILRKAGTERPFGEVYNTFKKQGVGKYVCAGCNTELFSSNEKLITYSDIQEPRCCVLYVTDILGMFLLVKALIRQPIRDTALMGQFLSLYLMEQ